MMSKKHYVAIANKIKNQIEWRWPLVDGENGTFARGSISGLQAAAKDLANYFESENPSFDRARFLAACGVQS